MTNNFLITAIAAVLLMSCKKEKNNDLPAEPVPAMEYRNLHDTAIQYSKPVTVFDFDGDGFSDLKFGVVLVGDPIEQQDKRQFIVSSGIHSKLPLNAASQLPVLAKNDLIPVNDFTGYQWWLVSSVLMAQRIENMNGDVSWEGPWKGTVNKYLPFQMMKNNQRYNGWVALSVLPEKIVLHRLALCKEAEKAIKAGN